MTTAAHALLAALWLGTIAARASADGLPDDRLCDAAGRQAEQQAGIPKGLLLAVGRVESGRALGGGISPWPWTLDVEGRGAFFPTRDTALSALGLVAPVFSVDVGCFQVNLRQHPDAFASLGEALDPHANAAYAARFLVSLHARTGSWEQAVSLYHSALLIRGASYRTSVFAAWSGQPSSRSGIEGGDPHVIQVVFFRPTTLGNGRWPVPILSGSPSVRLRLPHVITPD